MWVYLNINIPEDKNNKKFKREIFKTVCDVDKPFKGIVKNVLTKKVIEIFIKYFESDLNFHSKM